LSSSDRSVQPHHFRPSDNKEVDFVMEQPDGRLAGSEVKSRDAVTASDFRGLEELHKQIGSDFVCGIVLFRGSKPLLRTTCHPGIFTSGGQWKALGAR
jgi:hypothetical protein